LAAQKRFERVDCLNDVEADGLASNSGLVLLAVHPALLYDAEANVNNVDIVHPKARAAGVCSSSEEAEDEGIKPIGRVPIGGHALPVCLAILSCCLTVLVDEPEEEINEDSIRLAEASLLEGSTHLGQHGLKEDVGKGSVHCYNVCSHLLVSCVHCTDCGMIVVVNAHGVVGHVGYLGREGCEGIKVCFCGEESVDITRCCTKKQVHSCGGRRSMCLSTAAEVKKKFNQGLKRGNTCSPLGARAYP
jgi:hypothetical protein